MEYLQITLIHPTLGQRSLKVKSVIKKSGCFVLAPKGVQRIYDEFPQGFFKKIDKTSFKPDYGLVVNNDVKIEI